MALESSISSPDNTMAKELAINEAVKGATTAETGLKTKILKGLAALGIVTVLSVPANAQEGGVAKNSDKFPQGVTKKYEAPVAKDTNTVGTYKIEEPITDSNYTAKQEKLLESRERVKKLIEKDEKLAEQIKMLEGPFNVFKKIQESKRKFTVKDGKWANGVIESVIDDTEWLPEVEVLVKQARTLLKYISEHAPKDPQDPAIVSNNQ